MNERTFVYLPDLGIAVNLSQVKTVLFLDGRDAFIDFGDDKMPALCAESPKDIKALVAALGRVADSASATALEAQITKKGAAR